MRQRVADYIADFLVANGIADVFTVVGGGAMYLNDSFGHHPQLHCTYNHHEQACAIAAEAYARIENKIAAVCVTTGPGGTNAITGVAGAWMDSIPMLVLSGQARYATTVYASGLKLRTRGVQEFDIIGSVANMTKYRELVTDPMQIRYCLEKALYLAKEGRPGPCWLDIPQDVQAKVIETNDLKGFTVPERSYEANDSDVSRIIAALKKAKRPVVFVGNGVRLAGAHEKFIELVERLKAPVVDGMSSVDAINTDSVYYAGRNGTTGNRYGNFAIQECDLLLSLGSRQSFFQTGFNYQTWATHAYKIVNDIDSEELRKDSVNPDLAVCCDVKSLIEKLLDQLDGVQLPDYSVWLCQCNDWKQRYPVAEQKHYQDSHANIYAFYNELTKLLPANMDIVASCGTSRVAGSQTAQIKRGQRFITNPTMAAMGFGLPAAIGVSVAENKAPVVMITGEGSFQMNIQELQTIVQNKLPVMIFLMNNHGYHSIRMTQNNFFGEPLVGVGSESGDLSFPDLSKLIPAYGLPYYRIEKNKQIDDTISEIIRKKEACLCEVMLSTAQVTEPKVASKKLADGTMVSGTLEDMAPFLPETEIKKVREISEGDSEAMRNMKKSGGGIS